MYGQVRRGQPDATSTPLQSYVHEIFQDAAATAAAAAAAAAPRSPGRQSPAATFPPAGSARRGRKQQQQRVPKRPSERAEILAALEQMANKLIARFPAETPAAPPKKGCVKQERGPAAAPGDPPTDSSSEPRPSDAKPAEPRPSEPEPSEGSAAAASNASLPPGDKQSRVGGHSFKGVTKHRCTGRWEAHIWQDGKQVYLGGFNSSSAAATAYDLMAVKLKGASAQLNFARDIYAPYTDLSFEEQGAGRSVRGRGEGRSTAALVACVAGPVDCRATEDYRVHEG